MKKYKDINQIFHVADNHYEDRSYCTVVALALATGVVYGVAYKKMESLGRKHGRGVYRSMTYKALEEMGYDAEPVTDIRFTTVRQLTKQLPKKGTFLAHIIGHVLTIRDGIVEDWSIGSLRRVHSVCKITKKEYHNV